MRLSWKDEKYMKKKKERVCRLALKYLVILVILEVCINLSKSCHMSGIRLTISRSASVSPYYFPHPVTSVLPILSFTSCFSKSVLLLFIGPKIKDLEDDLCHAFHKKSQYHTLFCQTLRLVESFFREGQFRRVVVILSW
jgi:hypothetical protein